MLVAIVDDCFQSRNIILQTVDVGVDGDPGELVVCLLLQQALHIPA